MRSEISSAMLEIIVFPTPGLVDEIAFDKA
jgi:hypothetical protein